MYVYHVDVNMEILLYNECLYEWLCVCVCVRVLVCVRVHAHVRVVCMCV